MIWQDADTGAQLGFTLFYEKPSWLQDSRHALLNQPGNRLAAQIVGSAVGADHDDVTPVFTDSDSKPAGEYYSHARALNLRVKIGRQVHAEKLTLRR